MEFLRRINQFVLLRKKEAIYYLHSPAHNCTVCDKNAEVALERLGELVENLNEEKKGMGIQNNPIPLFSPFKKELKEDRKELVFLSGIVMILIFFLFITSQLVLTKTLEDLRHNFDFSSTPVSEKEHYGSSTRSDQ